MRFEPGITCVVGPNGSGKSNVVDALAWVMGEQGAKSLRGGKMEDVIFAGTSGRPPLGRAEVILTIDNTDGALPIDYTEVTISRIMFRNGGSEYAINGEACRLLDVQELLSDSGIGREMHVIVGQGQLDQVLSASPEDRRGFIEEAAGVLKHRKRKEKALRKLEAMQANTTRIQDLTAELRRQLKPLGRQAEVARRAAVVQADLRDARLRLLADDLLTQRTALEREVADETALRERRAAVEAGLQAAEQRLAQLEHRAAEETPRLARAQETWFALSGLRERLRGTASLAAERVRLSAVEPAEERATRDPDDLEREAAQVRVEEADLAALVERDRAALATAVAARAAAEAALVAEEKRVVAAERAAADRREGLARLTGQVHAARTRLETRETEIERVTLGLAQARERAERAGAEFTALETQVAGLDRGELDLDSEHERAAADFAAAEAGVAALREEERQSEQDRAALTARKEALELALSRTDGAAVVLAAGERLSGVLGTVAAVLGVTPGAEAAVAAALGRAADAVVVDGLDTAVSALRLLAADDVGQAALLVGGAEFDADAPWPALPDGAEYAVDLVQAPEGLRPALTRLLRRTAVVADLDAARALVAMDSSLVAVTRGGDVLGAGFAHGGAGAAPSLLEVRAAVEDAAERLTAAAHRGERLRFELSRADDALREASERVEAALARLHESDARLAAVAEQLGQLGAAARAAAGEAERLAVALAAAEESRAADRAALAELEARLAAAEQAPSDDGPSSDDRDRLAVAASAARQVEVEARLAVRTGEERVAALGGRADSLERAAREERAARDRAAARRARLVREAAVAGAVTKGVAVVLARLEVSLAAAAAERTAAEESRTGVDDELRTVRAEVRALTHELEQLTDSVHRDEVARAEQRLRIEQLETRALEELGVDPAALVAEYGPDQPVPPSLPAPGEEPDAGTTDAVQPQPYPYVRAEQEKRLRSAERALALLGRVNPLALEEYAALEERHQFLTEQLEDLRKTRRDLLDIVREVDERVEQVFTAAFEDTAREFEIVFARLFPGGEGRLVLTDPTDMLATGIDVEARPPGKKVKRLSLLSGGERSLVAVAMLVAIFKARPSPFYVLDEVEAALDDTNLGRLLTLLAELRESSQLIVITHQKRTMEIADALYGVSMRGDGVTTVISQRLREAEPA
ncbi:MAG: chromosome segregation protein SMC [Actinomycetia bacterium]|nr:chromosome segregation protein SMC [Actinomycetes bacterium]